MRTNYIGIIISAVAVVFAFLADALAPSCATMIAAGMALAVLACISIATLIFTFRWRKESTSWMRPLLLCAAIWLTIISFGRTGMWVAIHDWWFKRNLAAYNGVVASIRGGALPCNEKVLANLPPHIEVAYVRCCKDGGFWVAFLNTDSSKLPHRGYVYKDSAETSDCAAEFAKEWRARHIVSNWYRISD